MNSLERLAIVFVFVTFGCAEGEGDRRRDAGAVDEPALDAALDASSDAGLPGDDPGVVPLDASMGDAGTGAVPGQRPQTNVSFETAQRIESGDNAWLQDERSVDQVDYYVFSGEAGAYYEITTDRGSFSPDNVVVLYDSERNPIAQNDDGGVWSGDGLDVRLIVRLPESGDYFLEVQDPYTPPGFFGSSFPLLFYHLTLRELTEDTPGIALARDDTEVAVSFETDAVSGYAHVTLLADLGDGERTFDFEGGTDKVLIGHVLASGATGNGSSSGGGEVRVIDADEHALTSIDRALGQDDFHPPLQEESYRLTLAEIDAPADNAFEAIDLVLIPDNPAEANEDDNGEQGSAEPIALEGTTRRRGLVLMRLPEGDEDFFSIDVRAAEWVSVLCEAESGGSGVRGLHAELIDDTGVLGSGDETVDENLDIPLTQIPEAATVYLRMFTDGDSDGTEIEPWARCAINTGP